MEKIIFYSLTALIASSSIICNANSVIDIEQPYYAGETLFKEEDNSNAGTNNTQKNMGTTKEESTNSITKEIEYELAKQFAIRYELLGTQYNEHEIMSDKDFISTTSNFLNLIMGGKSNVIQETESTRKNFILLMTRPLLQQCENETCLLDFIRNQNIAILADNDRKVTYYEANLLLWRIYIQYKAKSFEQNALQDSRIHINKLITSNVFSNFEFIHYSNDREQFYKNAYKKIYGSISCFYSLEKTNTTMACTYNSNGHPYYIIEIYANNGSIQELTKLSSTSNELYLGR